MNGLPNENLADYQEKTNLIPESVKKSIQQPLQKFVAFAMLSGSAPVSVIADTTRTKSAKTLSLGQIAVMNVIIPNYLNASSKPSATFKGI
jgi:hypothetical protein